MNDLDLSSLLAGDRRTLAKAITLIESRAPHHRDEAQELLEQVLPHTGKALRVGISGSPGVGKSTIIEALGQTVLGRGARLAVLAVDPSSPIAGGSILGDKTRMMQLSREDNAFIRPSPTAGALGGIALKTRESMLLCEAAGFDVIFVETVGVGQSEYDVADLVDCFVVLMLPNAGDDIQGIKRGILELVDVLVVNKADGPQADPARQAAARYQNALDLLRHTLGWKPRVLTCSALEGSGVVALWDTVLAQHEQVRRDGTLQERRQRQAVTWMERLLDEMLKAQLLSRQGAPELRDQLTEAVRSAKMTPYAAAAQLARDYG